jgi:hypothetical protein
MVSQIKLDLNSDDTEYYIAGEGNWRYKIMPDYKANRKDVPRPMWLEEVREHLLLQHGAEIVNDQEVDDMCGIRLTQEGYNAICASLDKDLLTVPGHHYNFVKKERYLISPADALRNFYKQVITGDGADHIPAFDGKYRSKQPAFVQKLLDPLDSMMEEQEMYNYVLSVYENENGYLFRDPAYALALRAKVLHIKRHEEDEWLPPNKRKNGQTQDGTPL